jgi:hypothetical protein
VIIRTLLFGALGVVGSHNGQIRRSVCKCKRFNAVILLVPSRGEEALFRRRLQQLVLQKYGSLDRFYLETDFSKGHLSQILRGKRSPSLATMTKLAKALNVRVAEFFRPV